MDCVWASPSSPAISVHVDAKTGKKSEYRVEHKMGGCGVDRYSLLSDGHIALLQLSQIE